MSRRALATVLLAMAGSVAFFTGATALLFSTRNTPLLGVVAFSSAVAIPIAVGMEYFFMPEQSPFRRNARGGGSA